MEEKTLGLGSVIATGVGLIVATGCLLSLGIGTSTIGITFIISIAIACFFNILMALSVSELNALMPNLTGGLAQYSLAGVGPFITMVIMVGGYLVGNTLFASTECAMFGNTLKSFLPENPIPSYGYCIILLIILMLTNLRGVDVFAKIQSFVAYSLIVSLVIMGIMGCFKLGTGEIVEQEAVLSSSFTDVTGLCGLAFFLFIGCEYVIPIANKVKNVRRNVPLGMVISLVLIFVMQSFIIIGFKNYTPWEELGSSTTPHVLYGSALLGNTGVVWMVIVSVLAATSSVNTLISSLSYIAAGMAKLNLLPAFFSKKNKHGAPYISIMFFTAAMLLVVVTGLSDTDEISFFILVCCAFWMLSYVVTHINILVFRKRLPKAPRTFKIPFGPVIPIAGIAGTIWMIINIDPDPATKLSIYKVMIIIFVILAVYTFIWIKKVVKRPMFKPYPVSEVMAMENELYAAYHWGKAKRDRGKEKTPEGQNED